MFNAEERRKILSEIEKNKELCKYNRWLVVSGDKNYLKTTIIHEFGHIVANNYFKQIQESKYGKLKKEDVKRIEYVKLD